MAIKLPEKDSFRPDEVAKYTQYDRSTVYKFIYDGDLRAAKFRGRIRVTREALVELLEKMGLKVAPASGDGASQ